MTDPVIEPLKEPQARKLAREIIEDGVVEFSNHSQDEMQQDQLTALDCLNLLRGGVIQSGGFQNGEWRYRAATARMCVVFTFRSETCLRVVTAWRFK